MREFQKHIHQLNNTEISQWLATDYDNRLAPHNLRTTRTYDRPTGALDTYRRMTCALTLDALLNQDKDLMLQVLIPCEFAVYANDLVAAAQTRAGLPQTPFLTPVVPGFDFPRKPDPRADGLFFWRIGRELMWQQLDRRVDECVFPYQFQVHVDRMGTGCSRCCMRSVG